jgi:hypothetical protein
MPIKTSQWKELCLQAADELEPERRMAIVLELGRILGNDVHEFGAVQVYVPAVKSRETASLFFSQIWSFSSSAISSNGRVPLSLVTNSCAPSG